MHDFSCTDPNQMNYPVLAQRVRYFKEDTKGVTNMCRIMEEVREEPAREATHAKAVAVAQKMLNIGKMSYEEISDFVDLPVEEINALDTQKSA